MLRKSKSVNLIPCDEIEREEYSRLLEDNLPLPEFVFCENGAFLKPDVSTNELLAHIYLKNNYLLKEILSTCQLATLFIIIFIILSLIF